MKFKVTLVNGKYPLSCTCEGAYEAFKCVEGLVVDKGIDLATDMEEVMKTLARMEGGGLTRVENYKFSIEVVFENHEEDEPCQNI